MKNYRIFLDDGKDTIVSADSHESSGKNLFLYKENGEGTREAVGSYFNLKGWSILEDEPNPS